MRAKGLLDKQPHRRFRKAGLLGIYKPNGEMVVKTNGTRQKKQNTPKSRLDQQTFSDIVQAIKSPVDKDMIAAVRLQAGTTLLWRDILMMCAQGTLWTLRTPDGNLWLGARQLSQTIQNLLDSVSDVPGTILGRTGSGWQALLPGPAGYVLTSQGEANPPIYAPGGGGGGGDERTTIDSVPQSIITRGGGPYTMADTFAYGDSLIICLGWEGGSNTPPTVTLSTGEQAVLIDTGGNYALVAIAIYTVAISTEGARNITVNWTSGMGWQGAAILHLRSAGAVPAVHTLTYPYDPNATLTVPDGLHLLVGYGENEHSATTWTGNLAAHTAQATGSDSCGLSIALVQKGGTYIIAPRPSDGTLANTCIWQAAFSLT